MLELVVGGLAAIAGIAGTIYAALAYHRRGASPGRRGRHKINDTIPRQSPSFIGRTREIREVTDILSSRNYLVAIVGLGGIGKTALAIEVARRSLRHRLFEQVIWVSAKYRPISLSSFLSEVLSTRFYPSDLGAKPSEGAEIVRRELANAKILLIVDNYEDVSDPSLSAFLRDLPAPSKALLTSRGSAVDGATRYPLSGLPHQDASELARIELRNCALSDAAGDKNTVERLCVCAHGVPFVIKWFAGQVRVGQEPQVLLNGLESASLAAEELYDYIFEKTFEALADEDLSVLALCALFRNPVHFDDVLLAHGEQKPDLISRSLAVLVDQSLLAIEGTEARSDRTYALHPITATYVLHLVKARADLSLLVPSFYSHLIARAAEDARIGQPAFPVLTAHLATLLIAIDWCEENLKWNELLEAQQALSRFLWVRGRWLDRIAVGEKAMRAARFCGNRLGQAHVLMDDLGWTGYAVGRDKGQVTRWLHGAMDIFDQLGDAHGSAKTRRHLAAIARESHDTPKARRLYQEAQELCGGIPDEGQRREMEAGLALSLGKLALEEGEIPRAMKHFEIATERFRENQDSLRILKAMNFMARALIASHREEEASGLLSLVLEQGEVHGRVDQAALACEMLADIHLRARKMRDARRYAKNAVTYHSATGNYSAITHLKGRWPELL